MKCTNFHRRANKPSKDDVGQEFLRDVMDVWVQTAVAVAGSANCTEKNKPGEWADKVAADYAQRRKKIAEEFK